MRTALQFTSLLTLPVFVLVSFSEYLILCTFTRKKERTEQEREKERNKQRKKENSKETRN